MTSEVLQASLSRRSCKKYKADPMCMTGSWYWAT